MDCVFKFRKMTLVIHSIFTPLTCITFRPLSTTFCSCYIFSYDLSQKITALRRLGHLLTTFNTAPRAKSKMAARGPKNGWRALERCWVFWRSRQLLLDKFFDLDTPSMRKGRDGKIVISHPLQLLVHHFSPSFLFLCHTCIYKILMGLYFTLFFLTISNTNLQNLKGVLIY